MQQSIKNNKILFIVHTHGDEFAPLRAIQNVIKHKGKEYIERCADFLIANPIATEKNVRFIDIDLNRIYPGNINSELYEERRAVEVLEIARSYMYVIDMHTTISNSDIFIIVSKPTSHNLKLAKQLSINNIVIWESISGRTTGPITSYVESAVGVECSINNKNCVEIFEHFIIDTIDTLYAHKVCNTPKEIYKVTGSISYDNQVLRSEVKDFVALHCGHRIVYPLLCNQYKDKLCYVMEKIDNK